MGKQSQHRRTPPDRPKTARWWRRAAIYRSFASGAGPNPEQPEEASDDHEPSVATSTPSIIRDRVDAGHGHGCEVARHRVQKVLTLPAGGRPGDSSVRAAAVAFAPQRVTALLRTVQRDGLLVGLRQSSAVETGGQAVASLACVVGRFSSTP
jgi:hypothetical protein